MKTSRTSASAAKRWWFRKNSVTVYDRKPAGDFAYADMIHVVSDFIPEIHVPYLD